MRAPELRLTSLPDDLVDLLIHNAITESAWPGGWAVMRLLDRRCHRIWLAVVRGLPHSLDWLFARSCCACAAPLTAPFTWREPDRRGARWLPTPLCGVAKALPPLAKVWEGRLYEAEPVAA